MVTSHLLVTTDFSATSLAALDVAAGLLRRTGGRATLLHVQQEMAAIPHGAPFAPPIVDPTPHKQDEQAKADESRLQALVARLGGAPAATVVLRATSVPKAIVDWANHNEVDIIVIASRGLTPVAEILLGSTAKAVLRKSKVPVLLVPVRAAGRKHGEEP
jgi:nucleotide-binding universal stress UspA family protein